MSEVVLRDMKAKIEALNEWCDHDTQIVLSQDLNDAIEGVVDEWNTWVSDAFQEALDEIEKLEEQVEELKCEIEAFENE